MDRGTEGGALVLASGPGWDVVRDDRRGGFALSLSLPVSGSATVADALRDFGAVLADRSRSLKDAAERQEQALKPASNIVRLREGT